MALAITVLSGTLLAVLVFWIERWRPLLPSTLPALRWMGLRRILRGELFHALFYGRWIPQYISFMGALAPHLGRGGRRWMENSYHGKVLQHGHARAVITLEHDIPLQDLGTEVIPYTRARSIILERPVDIVVTRCGCKAVHGTPCLVARPPYETCILIGKPLTDFQLDHNPGTSRRITRGEALDLLDEFHRMGLVHCAWFKSCIRDQFYVICNCCSCCCLGFETAKHGIRQIVSSGFVARVSQARCKGCGLCAARCPFKAVAVVNGTAVVDHAACMGCGVCVSACPNGARGLSPDRRKGLPMDVTQLAALDTLGAGTGIRR